jgi:hypothetical protein
MIVLWGLDSDTPLAMVGAALCARGIPVLFVDQSAVCDTRLKDEDSASGSLWHGGTRVALGQVDGIYLRPFDTRRMPAVADLPAGDPRRLAAIAADDALLGWCETAPGRVVNRPAAMQSNNSKPYQAALIARAGFAVPDTIVTNDADAVRAFQARHGRIIYKSTSGIRSIVASPGANFEARLENLPTCPTQFQEHVAGTDIRIHVVGDRTFATEIRSEAEDYRYAGRQGQSVMLRALDLPPAIAGRAIALAQALGLLVAGIDMRCCADGRWVCFEVNPSPGFSFYEAATGQPIAAAIADLLAGA